MRLSPPEVEYKIQLPFRELDLPVLCQRIVIASNFTAELVKESLAFWMDKLELPFHLSFAPFDQIFQQLLNPSSELSLNAAGINVLLLKLDSWAGLSAGGTTEPAGAALERNIDELITALRAAVERAATPYVLLLCPGAPAVLGDRQAASGQGPLRGRGNPDPGRQWLHQRVSHPAALARREALRDRCRYVGDSPNVDWP